MSCKFTHFFLFYFVIWFFLQEGCQCSKRKKPFSFIFTLLGQEPTVFHMSDPPMKFLSKELVDYVHYKHLDLISIFNKPHLKFFEYCQLMYSWRLDYPGRLQNQILPCKTINNLLTL